MRWQASATTRGWHVSAQGGDRAVFPSAATTDRGQACLCSDLGAR